ncbi:sugar ABC transporter ATP-binding protein [Synergistaceae bacterium OttesenSCG-928-D05]|nr:sugar ABC transporter ATP-binding protein [Synergistaceae bacterium OttesenSCG-928-D05]
MSQCILELRNIVKEYFGNRVLKGVSLRLNEGEIHALIGENGAGKSTLMNILFGMPVIHNTGGYEGEIFFQGNHVEIKTPHDAMESGIGMVHQEFMLLPGFTITENIKLNRETTRANVASQVFGPSMRSLDMPAMEADARAALDRLGLSLDETLKVAGLPVGYMQFVEIARELDKKTTKILVLDEPTAVLTESEADTLLTTMERLAKSGIAILFITHRLGEVMRVADNITVLRDGEWVASMPKSEASIEKLAELMVGRSLENVAHHRDLSGQGVDTFVEIRDLRVEMPGEEVRGIDLDIRKGEILGIGGLAGQGKIGIANGVMGHYASSGTVRKEGKEIPLNNTPVALAAGMAFVSEDRRGVGLLLDQSIELNIAVPAMQSQRQFLTGGSLGLTDNKSMRAHALDMIQKLDIRCTGPEQLTRRLSGGNQQKVCIAKALTLHPNLLFVSEPTRGIDIGAKKIVLDLLVKLNREWGVTVVVTSSELAELRSICDRIAIIYEGKVEGILAPDASDRDFGVLLAGGLKAAEKEAS